MNEALLNITKQELLDCLGAEKWLKTNLGLYFFIRYIPEQEGINPITSKPMVIKPRKKLDFLNTLMVKDLEKCLAEQNISVAECLVSIVNKTDGVLKTKDNIAIGQLRLAKTAERRVHINGAEVVRPVQEIWKVVFNPSFIDECVNNCSTGFQVSSTKDNVFEDVMVISKLTTVNF